ncbi:hypothetical protein ONZ43_g2110 [Nemania bipapillata]|uniref:Uncharacterized protein n=1 Tax=Nemania bipapillata TaxID=110536 RepID=A0ACC2J268_9PEZI|nr:hypothetical protein ONZ43_g2110 [Nemania bipapillata]
MNSEAGLWNTHAFSHRPEAVKASARPVTIRPPRKNKRVTLLPDIIENPEPLPDKRGTLGIFQFPWGEKSENATLQYRPSQVFMAMPGTMTTARVVTNPMADARVAQSEENEYSSSFFDEYDEEEGDNFSDFSSGDDDFDETTLWEIASLLNTDQVPSKNSLLPMPWQPSPSAEASVLTDYVTDIPSDDEYGNGDIIDMSSSFEPIELVEEQIFSNGIVQSLLWTPQDLSQDRQQNFGLPQRESLGLSEHIPELKYRTKVRPQASDFELIRTSAAPTASKEKGGFFGGWFGKKTNKTSTTPNSEIPEESEIIVVRNLDEVPHTKSTRADSPHRQRATPRDWSAALHQAVFESYPDLRYSRGQTLAYQWNAGLQDEVSDSQLADFDVATRHPVFFGSLRTAAETVHPALTGYRVSVILAEESRIQHENPSTVVSTSPSSSSLWAKPLESEATLVNGLWALSTEEADSITSQDMRNDHSTSYYPVRGNKTAHVSVTVEKQGLWRRGNGIEHLRHPSSLQKNWLDDSVHKRFSRIELRY